MMLTIIVMMMMMMMMRRTRKVKMIFIDVVQDTDVGDGDANNV